MDIRGRRLLSYFSSELDEPGVKNYGCHCSGCFPCRRGRPPMPSDGRGIHLSMDINNVFSPSAKAGCAKMPSSSAVYGNLPIMAI